MGKAMTLEEYKKLSEADRMQLRISSLAQIAMLPVVRPVDSGAPVGDNHAEARQEGGRDTRTGRFYEIVERRAPISSHVVTVRAAKSKNTARMRRWLARRGA